MIGRAGSVIREIQEFTNTKISFKEDTDVDSPIRTCVITGDLDNIKLAEEKIKSILNNQPIIETYEKLVPYRTIAKITERNGALLRQIQNSSNAKLIIESLSNITDLGMFWKIEKYAFGLIDSIYHYLIFFQMPRKEL